MQFDIFCINEDDLDLPPSKWQFPAFDLKLPIMPLVDEVMPFTVNHWPIMCKQIRWNIEADRDPDTSTETIVMVYVFVEPDENAGSTVKFDFDPTLADEPEQPASNVVQAASRFLNGRDPAI